ncbi:hypothetical protein Q8791_24515 [Nocardiopsis sp. CT-R113]|uniref:Uncharacterized protein n=1 Tax=Nocardiopsis codii TaxID=3065942 RepID=A0ABU7KDS8_9ACTN|nr:hypothetical protein [Nocardiopsis sp. CT-R113]MEE2040388.1 hypothetical protein [Nocardiopsis sp. CT-R113]
MGDGDRVDDDGERDMRRRLVVGGSLNHGADIGRWRGHALSPLRGA